MDISGDKRLSNEIVIRVETSRFGPFAFQIGVDPHEVAMPLQRVTDAQTRFMSSPLSQVANRLEQEVLVSSIFSTNSIEGGTLTEKETRDALDLDPAKVPTSPIHARIGNLL
jgi:hypothetical protein